MAGSDEGLLVERTRGGDLRAFDALVERYKDSVYRFILHNVWKEDVAEDLAQETFVRAFQGLQRFRGSASFRTWLYRIALNLCIDHRRKLRASRGTHSSLQEAEAQLGPLLAPPDPDRALSQEELADQVQRAIRSLPERLRNVTVLYDLEGMSYQEIARLEGCPLGTVKSRLFAARQELRRLLSPYVQRAELPKSRE